MLKVSMANLWKKIKETNDKKYTQTEKEKEKEKIKKIISNRHSSQSPLHLDDIFIRME